jgi:hypothetical protein
LTLRKEVISVTREIGIGVPMGELCPASLVLPHLTGRSENSAAPSLKWEVTPIGVTKRESNDHPENSDDDKGYGDRAWIVLDGF